jgi:hypothetical protein
MSNSLKIRTNSDKARSFLFNAIVTTRKLYKSTKDNTKAVYTETKATVKAAKAHKI